MSGVYDGEVYALNATDGTEQWSYSRGGPGTELSSPAVVNGTVYIGGVGGSVYALNATDGTERWKTATTFDVQSSPTVWNDTVYIGSNEDVYALDTTTGTEQWSYPTNNKVYSTPTVVNGTVYVGSYDNNVYTLDAVKGTEQWTYTTGGFVFSSPTVVDGIAYFGSEDGNLYALHADDSVPILSEYTVSNPSNQNIAVRFNSDKLLTNLSASISGTESATLSTSDFTPTVDTDGNVTYEAIYTAGSEGSYTATLDTAADGAGNDAATSQAESVVLDAPPTISAYAVSNPSGQNVTVRFNATEQLSTISVSISNAESATLSSTDFTETAITGGNYTYDASYTGISDGTYTATLDTAADAAGNDGATGQQDSVIVDTTPPTAAAGENQTVDEDTTVQFNGSNTTDNTGIASYNWSFGDGMNATGQTVTHTYTDSGEYTVTLTVEDAAGNQDIDTSTVTVESSSNGGSGGNGGGGGSSRSTDTGSTVTVVPAQEPESSDSDDSSTRGSEAADSIDSQSVAVRGVSRGERVSVDFTTPDEDRTATDQDESTGDSDGSDEPTPRQVRNIVPDGLDIQFAEAGDYEFTVRTRDADTSDSAESEPSRTGDSGSAFRSDFSTNSLSDDGVRFARETRQRPVGFIEVDTEFETEAVETATHRFRVRKSYLESTDASVESVRLYRDEIAQWRELDTQQVRETEDYYFFEAETPGFSVFVIGTSAPVFETTDQQLIGFDESTGGVEATVSVENIGSKAGTYDAVLSADGETIGTAEASVDAAERADVTVTGTVETDDPVTLRLAGQSLGDVTRTKPTPVPTDPEQSGLRLVGVLLGVAVVVIGGLLWSRRKNGEETQ
jgi:FOG: WD40-like repeat